jgi:cytochrome bd-type quinol oxidase subunit 1
LRTSDAVSNLPVASVGFTAVGFFLIDLLLLVIFVLFACRIVRTGPDFSLPVPVHGPRQLSPEGHRTVVSEA